MTPHQETNVYYNTMPPFVPFGARRFKTTAAGMVDLPRSLGRLLIKAGFVFDGASMPWWCWSILRLYPTHPLIVFAAFIHDALYRSHLLTRLTADLVFWLVCRNSKLDHFRNATMHGFLRTFGGSSYKRSVSTLEKAREQVMWVTTTADLPHRQKPASDGRSDNPARPDAVNDLSKAETRRCEVPTEHTEGIRI